MAPLTRHNVEHEIIIAAPSTVVYEIIANVDDWPRIFPPTIFVEYLNKGARDERIRIWATANGEVKSWVSRRIFDPVVQKIDFQQEISSPPVASMGGSWIIEEVSDVETRVRLQHHYSAVNDDPDGLTWICKAIEQNSTQELAALKNNIELAYASKELMFSFEDSIEINASADKVFSFINDADQWTERLPHVSAVNLTELNPGIQELEMVTQAKDGSSHTTKSHRVTFRDQKIVYKQVTLPALMSVHTGQWTFKETAGVVLASSQHTVVINKTNVACTLGANASISDAKDYIRSALGTNSIATLNHAKDYAEQR